MVLLCTLAASGQSLTMTKEFYGLKTRVWQASAETDESDLPSSVDNSTSKHFPPIFTQIGGSCAQAATIGYMFTYEVNALLDRDASLPENRFSYLYTWNLVNGGEDVGTFQFEGIDIANSNGVMLESDFPKQTSAKQFRWASGFDKYLRAMKYKGEDFVNLEITDSASIMNIKQYLYNKGKKGAKGGVVVFSSRATGWVFNTSYKGPSETGYNRMLTQLAHDGGHAMTIVGYDDIVEFERPDGKISKGAFIVVNSYGENYWYHDRGRYYLPYWFFLSEREHGALSNDVTGIIPQYIEHPDIVFKVALEYSSRDDLAFRLGASNDPEGVRPEYSYPFHIFNHKGGDHPMQGADGEDYIEFGIDFSQHADKVEGTDNTNWFLIVERVKRGEIFGKGVMKAFEVHDYRQNPDNPVIHKCDYIDGKVIERGENMYNTLGVKEKSCSYSKITWINANGKPTFNPLIFRTADGKYAKVRFSDYDRENGTIKIKYVYAPSGSTNVE